MRILKRIAKAALKHVEKRAGLHVYRPVMNAQKWADWLQASGVPNAKTAEELAVTIFKASGAVAIVPEQNQHVVRSTSCVFAQHGTTGLAIVWYDYMYYDRHWALRELAGCEIHCCTSRAVLVLSDDIGDFELTDEMLLSAPQSIVLDGEATAPLAADEITVLKSAAAIETIVADAGQQQKAKSALLETFEDAEPNPHDQAVLYDLANGHAVLKSELAETVKAAEIMGVESTVEAEPEPVAQPEPVVTVTKSETKTVRKSDDEKRIIYGWASVSKADGETVIDYADDEITDDALHDLCHLIVKGQRTGAFEHDETRHNNEIVEAIVMDEPLQKALGIDLGRSGVLIGMHVPDDDDWAAAKDGDWEFSINATAVIEKPAAEQGAA